MSIELNMTRVADLSERYDNMVQFFTDVINSKGEDLNTEKKRNLLSVGFKNLISFQKSIWKIVHCNKSYAFSISYFYKRHYNRAYSTAEWRNRFTHLCSHRYRNRRYFRWFEYVRGTIIFICYKQYKKVQSQLVVLLIIF